MKRYLKMALLSAGIVLVASACERFTQFNPIQKQKTTLLPAFLK
ncbi:hypothetical protein [Pontibacter burrus]|nr:hypothetical protein [Pontibacter burrus]